MSLPDKLPESGGQTLTKRAGVSTPVRQNRTICECFRNSWKETKLRAELSPAQILNQAHCRIALEREFRDKDNVHEVSIMSEAVRMAMETAKASGASRVLALRLRVGALSGVVPEALEFAFAALTQGSPAEGATLSIEHVPAKFWCEHCQQLFESETLFAPCPRCKQPSHSVRGGRELELGSVEVE